MPNLEPRQLLPRPAHRGDRRHARPGTALIILMLLATPLTQAGITLTADPSAHARLSAPASQVTIAQTAVGELPTPWLDEVRTQRQAAEARRQANRESFEARRRAKNPWGAAHHEAWEENVQRRREARKQRLEQDRDYFRGMGPTLADPWAEPWNDVPPNAADTAPLGDPFRAADLNRGGLPLVPGTADLDAPPPRTRSYAPQDWNNLWYFRGY
ncbi:hypothetical protein [uncultured Lamprocystis sp.]|jgi:hypothetical protein|uniref:hypothetical protein n=1 Tax=uncultured Lamprocystis sp. TaxID=543132 RepID=UPI0025F33ECB|nr:hypothetical protein [uncultured Lamprocystis sp.]